MDGGAAVVWAVAFFQGSHQLAEIKLLVDLNEQMVGVDEIPQAPGCELEQVESLR